MAKKRATRKQQQDTLKLPELWKDDFRRSTMKSNFVLALSQSMIEFLSAVADDCHWDRSNYVTIHRPDNWISTEQALTRRGLIVRKSKAELDANMDARLESTFCRLTPAGEALVELLKVTGMFVVSDNASSKRRKAT